MKKPLTITIAAAVLIVAAALATLAVLTAYAGQRSGLDKSRLHQCAKLSPSAARPVTDPGYGERLAKLARCHSN